MEDEADLPSGVTIRDFSPGDLAAVAEIASASAEAAQWTPESYSELAASPGSFLLVAEGRSSLDGFVAAHSAAGEAEILNLAVRGKARRNGIGTAMLTAALQRFDRMGLMSVFLEVRESNAAAMGLYQKSGFSVTGRRKRYYRDPVEDAVCMMKRLTGTGS